MKVIVWISIFVLVVLYFGFFSICEEFFRDSGSFRQKKSTSFCGVKSVKIIETPISEYLTKLKIKKPELWIRTYSKRGGLFYENLILSQNFEKGYGRFFEILNLWLDKKFKISGNNGLEIENSVKPVVIKFIDCLNNNDINGLDKLNLFMLKDIGVPE